MGGKAEWMDLNDCIKENNKTKDLVEEVHELLRGLEGNFGNLAEQGKAREAEAAADH